MSPIRSCAPRSPAGGSRQSWPRATWACGSPRASWSSRTTSRRPAYLGGAQFPPALEDLRDPEAIELAVRFGQDLDGAAASDAPDWESYDERMGFIFTLLRAHQCDPALFELPPGTPGG